MGKQITKTVMDRLENYDGEYKDNISRQSRLRELTRKYDVETVALAAGFTMATLTQYLRVKHAPSINENSVLKAERILEGL